MADAPPPTDRLRELAREAARLRHLKSCVNGMRGGDFIGHKFKTRYSYGFAECLHPDCKLVREAVLVRETGAAQPDLEPVAQRLMLLLGPMAADAAIVGKTYGWNEVLMMAEAARKRFDELKSGDSGAAPHAEKEPT